MNTYLPLLEGLLATNKKTSLLFKNIVVSRTTLTMNNNSTFDHVLTVSSFKGPLTSDQFMEILQFDRSVSDDEWVKKFNDLKIFFGTKNSLDETKS